MKKEFLLLTTGLCLGITGFAQQKIQDGTVASSPLPNSAAILDLESNNKGLLLPRLSLSATNNAAPLGAHVPGMTIYNTNTAGTGTTAVTPGFYYNDGSQWIKLAAASSLSDDQQLSLTNNILSLEDGGSVSLAPYLDNTDNQQISLANNILTLTNGGTVDLTQFLDNTDNQQIQAFSFNAATNILTLTLEDGGTQTTDLSALKVEPWQVQNSTDKATANNQNIYQNGNVGIGNFSTANPLTRLDVRGSIRGGTPNTAATIGTNSFAVGNAAEATGSGSFSGGNYAKATNTGAVALGGYISIQTNTASGIVSAAVGGAGNLASGTGSVALGGLNNTSAGNSTLVTGENNNATSTAHHAFAAGQDNILTGQHGSAFGYINRVNGNVGTAFGAFNTSSAPAEFVIGANNAIKTGTGNDDVPTDGLFQIGNGVGFNGTPSNAVTVLRNGNIAIGVAGTEAAAKPTERLDIGNDNGGNSGAGLGGVRIRAINTAAYTGTATDNVVVADALGVLKTVPSGSLAGNDWKTTGNTGTDPGTALLGAATDGNYVGTTDNKELIFGTNGKKAAMLDTSYSLYIGTGHIRNTNVATYPPFKSLVVGMQNEAAGGYNIISGLYNKTIRGHANLIAGSHNTVDGVRYPYESNNNLAGGTLNTVSGWGNVVWGGIDSWHGPDYLGNDLYNINASAVFGAANADSSSFTLVAGNQNSIAPGANFAFAAGKSNIIGANATSSAVVGSSNKLYGAHSFASGESNTAQGPRSTIFGWSNNIATTDHLNFVAGVQNTISGASGGNYIFGGANSIVSTNTNYGSTGTVVFGTYNTARGWTNLVSGSNNTISSGTASNAVFGEYNTLGGGFTGGNFVTGRSNTTQGDYQSVLGLGLIGSNNAEVVLGSYNTAVNGAVLTVGNGTGPSGEFPNVALARSNAFVVTRNQTAAAGTNGIVIYSAQLPVYASDALADSDASLPSGAFYKVTGSRAINQKP